MTDTTINITIGETPVVETTTASTDNVTVETDELKHRPEVELTPTHAVKLLDMTDDAALVGGYGVVFGGVDLEGDTFTPETNYDLDLVSVKRVYYDHSLGDVQHPLGEAVKIEPDDIGLWVEAQLDRSKEYVEAVLKLIEEGVLGWSSGSIGHLVRREDNVIKNWPLAEISLTPSPAEPRTLGVERIKQLAEADESLKVLIPQDAEDASENTKVVEAETVDINEQSTCAGEPHTIEPQEVMKMANEVENTVQPTQEFDASEIVNAAVEDALKAYREKLEKEEPVKTAGVATLEPVKDAAAEGFKKFGDQLKAVQVAALSGGRTVDPRLAYLNKTTKATGLSEGVPSDGGFLVQTDFVSELMRRTYETGVLASRVDRYQASPNANGATINYVNETSRATGSRWGGIQGYWLAEAGTKTASKPEFGQMELKLKKLIGLCYATDELLADTNLLGAVITQGFGEEFAWLVDDAIYNGTGAGQPLGFMNGGSLVTVTAEVGQAAATVVAENIMKMWASMWGRSRLNAAWLINQDVEPQLYQLSLPVGTGGQAVYMPPGGLSETPYATLMGRPVIPVEQAATLGTTGDIALVDLSQYVVLEKGGIEAASSIHVNFVYDETAFRFVLRLDGQPKWASTLTPANGTNTLSPFVVLATRS